MNMFFLGYGKWFSDAANVNGTRSVCYSYVHGTVKRTTVTVGTWWNLTLDWSFMLVTFIHFQKYDTNTWYVVVNNRHRSIAQFVHANKQTINYKRSGQTLRCSDRIHISAVRRIICLLSSIPLFISSLVVITVLQIARLQALSYWTAWIQAAAK